MATYVKVAGTWREATSDSPSNGVCGYVKVNGTWRTVNQSYVKINGAWRSTCTAPGQQPTPVPQALCLRPTYCNNGTNGVILPTTEPCFLADGVTVGSRVAAYTCQTDVGCPSFTVPAGICTVPDPIIQVVSEEIGDCEFWGGLSGCTTGYAKRVTKKYSDSSIKVSYSCCDPLTPNLKYYCTLRPFTTGVCINELKDIDFTGIVVAGQGEWVCEALGVISFPSCSTTENCTVPKSSTVASEACGYLGTGQRSVTTRTFQSWCETTQDTIVGDCIGEIPKCGGAYCGAGSGEEEYPTSSCASGTGVRYKCVTPEGCDNIYSFRRCIALPPQEIIGTPVTRYTEICYTTASTSSDPISCRQFLSYAGPGTPGTNCVINGTSGDQFIPCPPIPNNNNNNNNAQVNCPVQSTSTTFCTTDGGRIGSQTVQVTPDGCEDIYGPCLEVEGSNPCSRILNVYSQPCVCPNGVDEGTQTIQETPGDCPNIEGACTGCPGVVIDTTPTCNGTCTYGSGNQPCGDGGTQSYCITAVGCPDIYGFCFEPDVTDTPDEPPVTNPTGPTYTTVPGATVTSPGDANTTWESTPTTDGGTELVLVDNSTGTPVGEPIYIPDLSGISGGTGKSININTLVRTRDGLVPAFDLKVGDKLLSADIATFPYDNLLATNMELIEWAAQNPHINLVETEIVNLRTRISKWAIIVDSDIFSDTHYILVNRNDVTKFVKAIDLERTDLIWSNTYHNWVSIGVLRKVDVNHEVVSIDCEPYDIFFTERMLTHDSNTVD
jgi:hypothetical protein